MTDEVRESEQACTLIYDGRCRLCVTAKETLERLGSDQARARVRMIPYQSGEAQRLLGHCYRPGRPDAAFLVGPKGEITRGVDAFLPLLPGLKGGSCLAAFFRLPLVRPLARFLYPMFARSRYRLFGEVPLPDGSHRGDEIRPPVQ